MGVLDSYLQYHRLAANSRETLVVAIADVHSIGEHRRICICLLSLGQELWEIRSLYDWSPPT